MFSSARRGPPEGGEPGAGWRHTISSRLADMSESLTNLLVSASLGALIGLIRQWSEQHEHDPHGDFAGLRTFTLLALVGHAAAYLTEQHSAAVFPVVLGLAGVYLTAAQVRQSADHPQGYTTFAASLLTLLIGGLVYWQHTPAAVILATGAMLLLGMKQPIHEWTRHFTIQDIRSTLQFAAITGVILPLVPNRGYGPFEAFNPFSMWLMVVMISGLGFVGYILMRLLGTKAGIALTGLLGGIASSTATTLEFSRRSKETPALSHDCALAVVLACTVMLARVLALLAALSPALVVRLWLPLLIMAIPGILFTLWLWLFKRSGASSVEAPPITNPLHLSTAIRFALIYVGVTFLVRAATHWHLTDGLLAISFVSGLTDVDAIVLTVVQNANTDSITVDLAGRAVIVAAVANTLLKAIMAMTLGSPALRKAILFALGLTMAAGVAAYWLAR
jgi:uncharacterized membrane protein (DUF4010 family)